MSNSDSVEAGAYWAELVRELGDGIKNPQVLAAMGEVGRHLFLPGVPIREAYLNRPIGIGFGQTVSQPAVVGTMTEALELTGHERVLEVGTGCGYQAAILSRLAAEVYTIEVLESLALEAEDRLNRLGYTNIHVRKGDGYAGWPEKAPFDRIIATAAPPETPRVLLDQLVENGILVIPVGPPAKIQRLLRYRKKGDGTPCEDLGAVRFVPMIAG